MTVRLAIIADYHGVALLNFEIQQMHAEALPHLLKPATDQNFTSAVFEAMLAQPDCWLYVAEADGNAVGYIYL